MSAARRLFNLERVLLAFFCIAGIAMLVSSRDYPLAARRLPQLIAALVVLLSSYTLLIQLAFKRGQPEEVVRSDDDEPEPDPDAKTMGAGMGLGMAVAFIAVAYGFGIGPALIVFISVVSHKLGLTWVKALIFGGAFAVAIWYAFGILLNVPLPEGMILHLF